MKVAILGNGPSLKLDKAIYSHFTKILITNRLIWEDFSEWNCPMVYVCADERFGSSPEWVDTIRNTTHEVFLSDELALIFSEERRAKYFKSYKKLQVGHVATEFMELFPLRQDMQANVVLDFGILVALNLGATDIGLFGCDFDYKIYKASDKPNYFYSYEKRGISFDHSVGSSVNWSQKSQIKFLLMKEFLSKHGVKLWINP